MTWTRRIAVLKTALCLAVACLMLESRTALIAADDSAAMKLATMDKAAIAEREKTLSEHGPKGATLVAYLDCGSQRQSAGPGPVSITCQRAKAYEFASEAKEVGRAQATVFYDASEVVFEIQGLDAGKRYMAGLTWWDYDNGSRTQSVVVSSPDGRLVRLAVPAIRLPNYTGDRQLPAERRFALPSSFAEKGRLSITVQCATGANAVVSELWIWQLP